MKPQNKSPLFPSTLQESLKKGFITKAKAEELQLVDKWVSENAPLLRSAYPGLTVTAVRDKSAPKGFRVFVGEDVLDAESEARSSMPGSPYVTLVPFRDVVLPALPPVVPIVESRLAAFGIKLQLGLGIFPYIKELADFEKKLQEKRDAGDLPDEVMLKKLPTILIIADMPFALGMIKDAAGKERMKVWAVDSQANTSSITKDNFDALVKAGGKPKHEGKTKIGVFGGEDVEVDKYSGLTMRFMRKNEKGENEFAECSVPVVVGNSNTLASDQMKNTKTKLIWDPSKETPSSLEKAKK